MKGTAKGIMYLFKKPLFGIICLCSGMILAAANISVNQYIGMDYGGSMGEAAFNYIINAAEDELGRYYVLDSNNASSSTHLYRFLPDTKAADLVIDNDELPFDFAYILNFCVDENNNIYVYAQGTDNIEAELWSQSILKFDSEGNFERELIRYNSDCAIEAMGTADGKVNYLLYDNCNSVQIISVDTETAEEKLSGEYISPYSNFLKYAAYTESGGYLISCINGEIISLDSNGKGESIFRCNYNVYDYANSEQIGFGITEINGKCYAVGGFLSQIIYEISDGRAEVLRNTLNELNYDEYSSVPEAYEYADFFSSLYNFNGKLAYSDTGTLTVISEDSTVTEISSLLLPFKNTIKGLLYTVIPFVSFALIILGAISCIGCLMHWHFTILSKMLWIMIPVICLMIGFFTKIMTDSIKESYYTNTRNQLIAISELSVDKFSGDMIKTITDYSILDNGMYDEIANTLYRIISFNDTEWSSQIAADIFICADNDYWISICGGDLPFTEVFCYSTSDKSEIIYIDNSETYIKPTYNLGEDEPYELCAFTPICDSDGNKTAMLVISVSLDEMKSEIYTLQSKAIATGIIFMFLLIITESLTSIYIVGNLRKASTVISGIAKGDFSSRIVNPTKDELGEICNGVNNMAVQLQTLFSEKDKNERFYYKFVPEKFRELLHKDYFTDLALGDAESADLTVLFCDIRSFSLNSEMMTAKENFEFVNIIYGKAGPIIRRNNGFVDKYIGDAVMALFENADDAVSAGIELYSKIVLDPESAKELNVSSVNIGIGIHSGMARIGIVGEEERMSGTVISNTVNLASRLESLTKQYNTAMIISKDTLDRMSDPDSLNTRYLGMIQVAGVNEVKALYEVLDALDDTQRSIRSASKGDFREGVKLFHLGKPEEALAIFEKIKSLDNGIDIAVDKYISYIKKHMESGDTNHNFFRFSRK